MTPAQRLLRAAVAALFASAMLNACSTAPEPCLPQPLTASLQGDTTIVVEAGPSECDPRRRNRWELSLVADGAQRVLADVVPSPAGAFTASLSITEAEARASELIIDVTGSTYDDCSDAGDCTTYRVIIDGVQD